MKKYKLSKTAKFPAAFIPVYVNCIIDNINKHNFGYAAEFANELYDRIHETDWKSFKEWLNERGK